jgi:prolyl oligopeptidase
MSRKAIFGGVLFAVTAGALPAAEPAAPSALVYPKAKTVEQVDDYHGTKVSDPYRWMEDLDSPDVAAWVGEENKVTGAYLAQIPEREAIEKRLTELWDYEKYGVPNVEGSRYFLTKNDGLQNQSVLYWLDRLAGEPRLLLDPNTLSADGTVALSATAVSRDGKRLAYALATAGSDWIEWKVRDVDSGKDLADHIRWSKFSDASWMADGAGFFYSRYDAPAAGAELEQQNYFQKLYYHRLGTPQERDLLVYERKDHKEWGFDGAVTDDGRYLVVTVWQGTDPKNAVFYKELRGADAAAGAMIELLPSFDATYTYLGNDGPLFWFFSNLDAPRGKVIAIDVRKPQRENWRELVPQGEDTLENVDVVGDRFVAAYLHDATARIRLFALDGRPAGEVELPGLGTVEGFTGRRADRETFYSFSGFTTPGRIYRLDLTSGKSEVFRQPKLAFDRDGFETRQVFFSSGDGTRVPMFLVQKKGLPAGPKPTILYGYGGFNVSLTPVFSVSRLVWMERGGVYAVPNLRGGGEYGEAWHQAGTKLKKQNVFDDFIAAADWLVKNGVTTADQLAISGGSNGGLLVGAAMTQRPDLFAVALPAVGVMDMLRFHKFTIGWAWTSDYGSADDQEEFKAIYAYSPLHNLKPGTCYPATLVTTADHDDRVVPAHSFKFAAALQAKQGCSKPTLIRIETRAGHGEGKPTSKQIEEAADVLAFTRKNLGMGQAGLFCH